MTDNDSPVLTIPEAALYLKVSVSTIRRLLRSGALGSVRVGSAVRIPKAEVEMYLHRAGVTFTPNPGQAAALDALDAWWAGDKAVFTLHGPAGSGKSSLAKFWCASRGVNFQVVAPTVRAARLWPGGMSIHKAIYGRPADKLYPLLQEAERLRGEARKEALAKIRRLRSTVPLVFEMDEGKATSGGLLVCDEALMCSQDLGWDLASTGRRILALGDAAQLAPISGVAAFRDADFTLTEVMRHGPGSEVYLLAEQIRTAPLRHLPELASLVRQAFTPEDPGSDMVLGGTRRGCHAYNMARTGGRVVPEAGDIVLSKVNQSERKHKGKGLPTFNGARYTVREARVRDDVVWLDLAGLDYPDDWSGIVPLAPFGSPDEVELVKGKGEAIMAFGFASTVHGAQGGEWGRVRLLPCWMTWAAAAQDVEEARRIVYTAVTRAKETFTTGPGS